MPNSSFSQILPKLQLAFDSTSLGELKRCPRAYEYTIIEGYEPRGTNVHLRFGIDYGGATEVLDRARVAGETKEEATRSAVRYALDATWNKELNRPWASDSEDKNRETLLRSVIAYADQFGNDALETLQLRSGEAAAELSFKFEIPGGMTASTGESFSFCGYLDRVVTWNERVWVTDRKAQPKRAKVLTPNGWTTIGELNVGDLIAGMDGRFKKVISLFPKGITKVFKIEFVDGTVTTCGEDHLWTVADEDRDNWRVLTMNEVLVRLHTPRGNMFGRYAKLHVPLTKAVQHPTRILPLSPYLLGALLGNGYLNGNSVAISTGDQDLINNILPELLNGEVLRKSPANNLTWTITGGATLAALRELGLWGVLSQDKFIPSSYLFANISQRKALLQGLLDTDGSWDGQWLRYQTTSEHLAIGVCDLVRSLGGSASLSSRLDEKCKSGIVYKVILRTNSTPLKPRRKYIKYITQIPDEETVCIEIEKSTTMEAILTPYFCGLYLTDDYIVTHNTTKNYLNSAYFAKYTPDNQVSLYIVASRIVFETDVTGMIIDAMQVTANKNDFRRGIIERTESQLNEWIRDAKFYISLADLFARQNYWPQNDKSCLAGSSIVSVSRGTNKGKKMTIEKLYKLFHKKPGARYGRKRPDNLGIYSKYGFDTYILSDVGGIVSNNLVLDIIHKGKQPVFCIETAAGTKTRATGDHEFETINGDWIKVEDLKEGDILNFWNPRGQIVPNIEPKDTVDRNYVINIPYYEGGGWKKIHKGYLFPIICQRRSRLIWEANMNNVDYDSFINILRTQPLASKKLKYLAPNIEVHHKNEDPTDDSLSNLEALPMLEHKHQHNMRFNVNRLDAVEVKKVYPDGETDVYDISMQSPHNNFVVDGLVAHNCGATYLDPKTGEVQFGCPFRSVCSSGPEIRQTLLDLNYKRRVWDPLKIREAKRNQTKLKQELRL